MSAGALYLVATPIGNLEDITLRALRILREADLIACEDTRRTGRLLKHFEIDKPLLSCHDRNEAERGRQLAQRAAQGEAIALVSDAGTPVLADPGYRVVQAALAEGVRVVPVPGPNAAIAALAASGLPPHAFVFRGFLPARKGQRRKALAEAGRAAETVAFYEAPHRIVRTLADIADLLGARRLVLARELTKLHEEFLRGTADSILEQLRGRPSIKGEFVLLLGPAEKGGSAKSGERGTPESRAGCLETNDPLKRGARKRRVSKRAAAASLHGLSSGD